MGKASTTAVGCAAICVVTLSTFVGCNKATKGQSVSAEIARAGRTLIPTGLRYSDLGPSISDAGDRIVFTSGRDSSSTPVLKSYKITWASQAAPGETKRVTNVDIGYEREAILSPDGQWILLASLSANQVDIYIQSFDDETAAIRVTSDSAVETQLSFSPDSQMVAWLSTDSTSGETAVKVAKIGAGTAIDLSDVRQLPTESEHVDQVFWLPAESGAVKPYILVTASESAESSGTSDLKQHAFAALGDISGVTGVSWLKGVRLVPNSRPAVTASNAVMVEQVIDSSAQALQLGTGTTSSSPNYAPLKSAPIFVNVPDAKILDRYGYSSGSSNPPPGFDVRSVGLTGDGANALVLAGVFFRCSGDTSDQFGTTFAWAKLDATQPYSMFNPLLSLGGVTEPNAKVSEAYSFAATDLCSNRQTASGLSGHIDDQISTFVINGQATKSVYRVVYVTRATAKLDKTCNLSAGDQEIWALDVNASGQNFYSISNNHDPSVLDGNTLVQGECRL